MGIRQVGDASRSRVRFDLQEQNERCRNTNMVEIILPYPRCQGRAEPRSLRHESVYRKQGDGFSVRELICSVYDQNYFSG